MDNFQLLLVNAFIATLWCIIGPCLSASIYLFLAKSDPKQMVYAKVSFTLCIVLLLFVVRATFLAQTINPICAGIGDPNRVMCAGYGFVPNSEVNAITSSILLSDLVRTTVIPVIASFIFGIFVAGIHWWRRAKAEKLAQ